MQIAPSILSSDFARLKEEIESIKNCDMVHIDVLQLLNALENILIYSLIVI